MNAKSLSLLIAGFFSCDAQAQDAANPRSGGWNAFLLNEVTVQKSSEDALRNRPSPFRPDLVSRTGGRLLDFFALQFKRCDWTFMGSYSDNRTLGGGSAYSLTNPMVLGVNTVETTSTSRDAVDTKSGLQELAATYRVSGTMVMVGKIDTTNWYLADPLFGGDLSTGNEYGNAATRVVAPPSPRWRRSSSRTMATDFRSRALQVMHLGTVIPSVQHATWKMAISPTS